MNTYFVDNSAGDDSGKGTEQGKPWKTLAKVSGETFQAGDRILLRSGGVWNESLNLSGRAPAGNPILLSSFGEGPRPRINGGETHAVTTKSSIAGWRISGLELTSTNKGNPDREICGGTCGIYLEQEEQSDYLCIDDCIIHDTSGPGIYVIAKGSNKPVFQGILIEHCEIYRASCGIQFISRPEYSTDAIAGFRIAYVTVHDIGGDGIVPFCSRDGVIEHCVAYRTGMGCAPKDHSPVAIWYAWAKRCVIQFCEAYDNHTGGHIPADGGGFDLDGGCSECVMQYNYSHDNDGAGYLICSWDPKTVPCTKCVTRYNLSVNDGLANDYSSILFWQSVDCLTYNNTCIIRKASPLKFTSLTHGHLIANNIFCLDSREDLPLVKSEFDISGNMFRNNLYYRNSSHPRFSVQGKDYRDFADFQKLVQGKGEILSDPGFAGFSGDYRLGASSPCKGTGLRIPGMGLRDYFGIPIGTTSPVDIGFGVIR